MIRWVGRPPDTMIPKKKHIPALLVELGADVNVHGKEGATAMSAKGTDRGLTRMRSSIEGVARDGHPQRGDVEAQ